MSEPRDYGEWEGPELGRFSDRMPSLQPLLGPLPYNNDLGWIGVNLEWKLQGVVQRVGPRD